MSGFIKGDVPFPSKVYLTKADGRYGDNKAKLHMTLGHARSSIANGSYYGTRGVTQIWELDGGRWTLIHDIPERTTPGNFPWQVGK